LNLDGKQNVLIQGITGREAGFWVEKMLEYGTNIVAGTSPGKGGTSISGIPVYNTVLEAVKKQQVDTAIQFIPPRFAKAAAMEAIEAGVKQIIILGDGVPVHDTMTIIAMAETNGVTVFGPNTPGMVFPGVGSIGIMPCWLEHVFNPGSIAILSRSGSLGNEISYQVSKSGFGISKFIGIGGDALVGTTFADALQELDKDDNVEAVVIVGELGGNMEETAARIIPDLSKPVFAFIAGKAAPQGVPMGHAGALVEGSSGSAFSKVEILREHGVKVADVPDDLPGILKETLRG